MPSCHCRLLCAFGSYAMTTATCRCLQTAGSRVVRVPGAPAGGSRRGRTGWSIGRWDDGGVLGSARWASVDEAESRSNGNAPTGTNGDARSVVVRLSCADRRDGRAWVPSQ
ncbi:hypothetical protein C8F01DRAFT_274665 [Mycena amicta]|nr:hypothetical protein C8F01DRAFT_274665 [Mycena amicta]